MTHLDIFGQFRPFAIDLIDISKTSKECQIFHKLITHLTML